jgi:ABC-type amino acid transport substrate-binding protein
MTRCVSTWFYEQSSDEGGSYAQVRGDSSTQDFRDIYRRCIATFFASARRVNPDAELVLHLNSPWDSLSTRTAQEVGALLDRLGVRRVVLDYTYAPPPTWPDAWRNQFFVLDVLADLAEVLADDDVLVVLDSDVVWSGAGRVDDLWEAVAADGALTYRLDYTPDHVVNGCSRRALTELASSLGVDTGDRLLGYSGGELVALRGDTCVSVIQTASRLWPLVQQKRDDGVIERIEEAHLLSLCYADLGLATGGANAFLKRLWTQPLKHQNVESGDELLDLWHVPAEKRYGLRRLYRDLIASDDDLGSLPSAAYLTLLKRRLGVPTNTPTKVAADLADVGRMRASALLRRADRRDARGTTRPSR